ncbi:MAG: dihydrodipicolinate synthase family protein, partial [Candidatus Dormibacterales bacterium]
MDLARLSGIFTPLLTPLTSTEEVDEPSLRRLVDHVVAGGVQGVWAMGTTGEFGCLHEDVRARGIEVIVDQVRGRVPVVANVGDGSTSLALRHAARAAGAGASALASTPPHYFHHSADEVCSHFRGLKEAFPDLPLLAYNIPQTVKVRMTPEAVLELTREGVISGIKDSQNDLVWFRALVEAVRAEGLRGRFRAFLGTRALVDVAVAVGADGSIPANSNVAPEACAKAHREAVSGTWQAAREAQALATSFEDLSSVARSGSPNAATLSTLKNILHEWGVIADPRLARPLRPLAPEEVSELRRRLAGLPAPRGAQA